MSPLRSVSAGRLRVLHTGKTRQGVRKISLQIEGQAMNKEKLAHERMLLHHGFQLCR